MKRTPVNIEWDIDKIEASNKILFLGSCFSDNVSQKLSDLKFDVLSNPFGVVFHPEAICTLVQRALEERVFEEKDFFEYDSYWYCFETHSSITRRTLQESLQEANQRLKLLREWLISSDYVFFTWGTSWGYQKGTSVVANCHKQAASEFVKKRSSVEELKKVFTKLMEKLKELNPTIKIGLTVSPVRHIKDGVIENARSKAALLLLCDTMRLESNVIYFPSYEIVQDELRDYAYFKSDGIHLNDIAINYVFNRFLEETFSDSAKSIAQQVTKINLEIAHKPKQEFSSSNRQFKQRLLSKIKALDTTLVNKFRPEIQQLENELSNWPEN